MAKPPPSTPHSDIDGVHEDERRNTDVASERGESAEELDRANRHNVARPEHRDDKKNETNRG